MYLIKIFILKKNFPEILSRQCLLLVSSATSDSYTQSKAVGLRVSSLEARIVSISDIHLNVLEALFFEIRTSYSKR